MSAFQTSLFSLALVASTWLNSPLSAQSSSRTSGSLDFAPLTFGNANSADKVDVELTAALRKVDDQTAELQVTMILPTGYYTYSMDKSFGAATKIKLSDLGSLIDSGEDWKADHEPKVVQDELLGQTVEKFSEKVTWSKTLKGTVTAETIVTGKLSGQYCGSGENGVPGECRPINNRSFTAKLAADSLASAAATAVSEVNAAPGVEADKNSVSVSPKIGYGKSAKSGLMEFEISLTPAKPAVGQEVTLSIKAKVKEPWHTFALDQDPEMAGLPTTIEIGEEIGRAHV